jgi:hypothetical protein
MSSARELIENTPWQRLRTVTGTGAHVGRAILGLLSPSAHERERAYWSIDNCVVVQSDLYEAAFRVVPCLIALLEEGHQVGRDLIYELLYEIGHGYAPDFVTCMADDGTALPLREACRSGVGRGLRIYLRDVELGQTRAIRHNALEVVIILREYRDESVPRLKEFLERETDRQFQEEIRSAIDELEQ